jgi:uncharacterized protein (DUF1501 family)
MNRRVFLKNGTMALVSLGFAPAFIAETAAAAQRKEDPGRGLPARRRRRPEHGRAVRRPELLRGTPVDCHRQARRAGGLGAVDLDGFFGLHPRMAPLAPWFSRGQMAVVHASGSHDETRSHFDAQDFMESGTPGVKSTRDGWMNRYLHARDHERASPFRAVAIAQQMPRSLQGTAPALAIGNLGRFGIRDDIRRDDRNRFRSAVRRGRRCAAAAGRP